MQKGAISCSGGRTSGSMSGGVDLTARRTASGRRYVFGRCARALNALPHLQPRSDLTTSLHSAAEAGGVEIRVEVLQKRQAHAYTASRLRSQGDTRLRAVTGPAALRIWRHMSIRRTLKAQNSNHLALSC